jgi:hypothetical protein
MPSGQVEIGVMSLSFTNCNAVTAYFRLDLSYQLLYFVCQFIVTGRARSPATQLSGFPADITKQDLTSDIAVHSSLTMISQSIADRS